jgi:hypothetical protein
MKFRFEDEDGVFIKETKDNIFLPRKDDLIYLDNELFCVMYLCFDYDKNIIEINIERQ